MSIRVENISKLYGSQTALNNVSFSINKGEIVGLLGPNGAGKTTLMKIITAYLTPQEGSVFVNDLDIEHNQQKIKSCIGYLPENNPLYLEMYVREYLQFVLNLYPTKKTKGRLNEVIDLCGLTSEQNKKIAALSKGFKQRVGIAQALIHQPDVLILDEPTSGLDPNQLIEIRNLIKEIGKDKTVLLSSHYMQEVEAICNRVLIINKGEVIADARTEILTESFQHSEAILLELEEDVETDILSDLEGVKSVKSIGLKKWELLSSGTGNLRKELFAIALKKGWNIISIQKKENSLEEVFQKLTQEV